MTTLLEFEATLDASISDFHLHVDSGHEQLDVHGSLLFPGPRRLPPELVSYAQGLIEQVRRAAAASTADFRIVYEGVTFRARRDAWAVDGVWYRLRRMPGIPAGLDTLPTPLPTSVRDCLMKEALLRGGLIYVAGRPGSGKTTTGSATVVSRLNQFGGVCYTVEDPPEMPLNGWHGLGYCTQTSVPDAHDRASAWAEAMRGILRSQPVGTHLMMYVGEVRDAETARTMLLAASNGFLVISTGFCSSIVSGIDSLFQLVGREENAITLASVLRLVIYQKIETMDGRRALQAEFLESESDASPVAAIIRSGRIAQLNSEIEFQRSNASRQWTTRPGADDGSQVRVLDGRRPSTGLR